MNVLPSNVCVDDGAVIDLNGTEVGRTDLPDGPVFPGTTALHAVDNNDEGYYPRVPVRVELLRPGRNVFAVEVHCPFLPAQRCVQVQWVRPRENLPPLHPICRSEVPA